MVPAGLRWRVRPVDVEEANPGAMEGLAEQLIKTMIDAEGIGLAANQVAIATRMFVTLNLAAINPTIRNPQYYKDVNEGCLSLPDKYDMVGRAKKLTLEYFDVLKWDWVTRDFIGPEAHIIQHEVDHLNGVLYTDYEGIVTGR